MKPAEDQPKPAEDWHTMTDPEVMGRLLRRGCEPVTAKGLIRDRLLPDAEEQIAEWLDKVYLDHNEAPIKFEHPIDRRVRR